MQSGVGSSFCSPPSPGGAGQQVCSDLGKFSATETSLALPHCVEERKGVNLPQEGRKRVKGERAGTWEDGSWTATKIPY